MDEESNMVIYSCRRVQRDGTCASDAQMVSIMSNGRHPQTVQLYKSAQQLEQACIDVLQLVTLDTYSM
jgi:hypothetical protein